MYTITFDAAQAKITPRLPDSVNQTLNHAHMWWDKSAEYNARQKPWASIDPRNYCYDIENQTFGTGLMDRVWNILQELQISVGFNRLYRSFNPEPFEIPEWAYRHQRDAVTTMLHHRRCCIQIPTGSGKSVIAAFFLSHFPRERCLVIVPSSNLMKNIASTLEPILNEPIGRVGDGKQDWQRVTVAIINSLHRHRKGKFAQQLQSQTVLLIDEAHEAGSPRYTETLDECPNTVYRIGLTATAERPNGDTIVMEQNLGPTVLKIPEEVMVNQTIIHKPQVFYIEVESPDLQYPGGILVKGLDGTLTTQYPRSPNGKPDRADVYRVGVVEHDARNELAVRIVKQFLATRGPHGTALLLFSLQEHGAALKSLVEQAGISHDYIDFKITGEKRNRILDRFRNQEFDCLVASNVLNQGEDVPKLELIVNAAGGSSRKNTIQRTGRGVRMDSTGVKKRSLYVDFIDSDPFYLRHNSNARRRYIEERFPSSTKVIKEEDLDAIFQQAP